MLRSLFFTLSKLESSTSDLVAAFYCKGCVVDKGIIVLENLFGFIPILIVED